MGCPRAARPSRADDAQVHRIPASCHLPFVSLPCIEYHQSNLNFLTWLVRLRRDRRRRVRQLRRPQVERFRLNQHNLNNSNNPNISVNKSLVLPQSKLLNHSVNMSLSEANQSLTLLDESFRSRDTYQSHTYRSVRLNDSIRSLERDLLNNLRNDVNKPSNPTNLYDANNLSNVSLLKSPIPRHQNQSFLSPLASSHPQNLNNPNKTFLRNISSESPSPSNNLQNNPANYSPTPFDKHIEGTKNKETLVTPSKQIQTDLRSPPLVSIDSPSENFNQTDNGHKESDIVDMTRVNVNNVSTRRYI